MQPKRFCAHLTSNDPTAYRIGNCATLMRSVRKHSTMKTAKQIRFLYGLTERVLHDLMPYCIRHFRNVKIFFLNQFFTASGYYYCFDILSASHYRVT